MYSFCLKQLCVFLKIMKKKIALYLPRYLSSGVVSFQPKENPLSFLSFRNIFILFSFLKNFHWVQNLGLIDFSFSSLEISAAFWPPLFVLRRQLFKSLFSCVCFSNYIFISRFSSLTILYLDVIFFIFILFGFH